MPTLDNYGQGVQIAALTDAPNAEKLAKDIVNALVPQTIMRFQSANERDATVASPAGGMMAWLETERLLTEYDGTQWAVVAAGSQAWTKPTLVAGYTHNGNSNGDFRWRKVNLFGEDAIFLEGAIGVTYNPAIPNSGMFLSAALPASARPTSLRTVTIPCSDVNSTRITLKLDAKPDGHLEIYGTNSSDNRPIWIGFNGVHYTL